MTQQSQPSKKEHEPAKVMTEAQMEKHQDDVSAGVHEPPADPKAAKAHHVPGREVQVVKPGESGVAEAQRRTTAADKRRHMEEVIKRGETMFYHDPKAPANSPPRIIATLDQIPHESELAGENAEDQAAAKKVIDAEISRLEKLRDGIGKTK